jgi:hypothetical protein
MPLKISPFKPDWRGQLVLPLAGAAPRRAGTHAAIPHYLLRAARGVLGWVRAGTHAAAGARFAGGGVHLAEASLLCSVGGGTVLNALSGAASR